MSGAVISSNTSLKVNRAISATTTVSANSYAIVDYLVTGYVMTLGSNRPSVDAIAQRYFGPSQSVPATYTATIHSGAGDTATVTYTLQSGVEFINSP